MANYTANFRSNHFKVKDPAAFEAWCESRDLVYFETSPELGPLVGFYNTNHEGGIPNEVYDAEADDYVEIDLIEELSEHLLDDQVAVVIEVGNEKLRYLVGYAVAVTSTGERIDLSLGDIYERARGMWGIDPTIAEY